MKKPNLAVIGNVYQNLKILDITNQRTKSNQILYKCECLLCGNTRLVPLGELKRGNAKDCGCSSHKPKIDLTGKVIDNIQVMNTLVIENKLRYKCKCLLCGKVFTASYQDINNYKSCGCYRSINIKKLYADGTAPCKLKCTKLRNTNTSGVTGVSFDKSRNKWVAEIIFKSKKYHLGRYSEKKDAIEARKKAEQKYFQTYLDELNNTKKV